MITVWLVEQGLKRVQAGVQDPHRMALHMEQERQRRNAFAVREADRLRAQMERDAKRAQERADKEAKAEEKRKQQEDKKRCRRASLHCGMSVAGALHIDVHRQALSDLLSLHGLLARGKQVSGCCACQPY